MVQLLEHAPSEDQHVLITACLARDLKDKPSYTGPWQNNEQKYELTKAYAQVMATRIKGKGLMAEHFEDNGPIGEIVHTWIDNNEWHMQAVIDTNTRAGMDIVAGMLDENNPFGDRIGEVSLASEGFNVVEASVVKRGARPGSTIDRVELVSKAQLDAIKKQEYKVDMQNIPDYIPQTGAPRICASFGSGEMASYISVRNPAPPVTYASQAHAPAEAAPVMSQVELMRQAQAQQQQIYSHSNNSSTAAAGWEQSAGDAEGARTTARTACAAEWRPPHSSSHRHSSAAAVQQSHAEAGESGDPNDPTNSGNIHTLHSNPEDDKLLSIAGVFQGAGNVLSNQQKQEAATKLLEVAASTKATREALAAKETELAEYKKRNSELEEKVQHHEGDLAKQKRQTAAMLKKILIRHNPPLSSQENTEMTAFEENFAAGKTDRALEQARPFLIRASALIDASDQAAELHAQQTQAGNSSSTLMADMAKILNTGSLVQASYGNRLAGQKRGYDSMDGSSAAAAAARKCFNVAQRSHAVR